MPEGLTLRRRGFKPVAQTEKGLPSQAGRKSGVYGAGWTKSTQLSADFPNFNCDPWTLSRLRLTAGESGPLVLPPSLPTQGPWGIHESYTEITILSDRVKVGTVAGIKEPRAPP